MLTFYTMTPAVMWVNYELNKAEITDLFCINKDKPRLQCDGKCHLKTQIDKLESNDSNSDQENTPSWRFDWKTDWVSSSNNQLEISHLESINHSYNHPFLKQKPSRFSEDFFHPPQV